MPNGTPNGQALIITCELPSSRGGDFNTTLRAQQDHVVEMTDLAAIAKRHGLTPVCGKPANNAGAELVVNATSIASVMNVLQHPVVVNTPQGGVQVKTDKAALDRAVADATNALFGKANASGLVKEVNDATHHGLQVTVAVPRGVVR